MMIYLVRHGAIDTGQERRFIGQIDLPLASSGIRQAEQLRNRLAGADLAGIYCSDLSRSLETARIIAANHPVPLVTDKDLREISLGAWEGHSFAEIRRRYPTEFARRGDDIAGYVPPGGESFASFGRRIMTAFNRLVEQANRNILIVGHAGVNRVIISRLLGMPWQNIFYIGQDYACLNIICREKGKYKIKLLNSTEHLQAG